MLSNLWFTARSYYAFYGRFFSDQWENMSPFGYGMLLIGVCVFGWLMMKSTNKRT